VWSITPLLNTPSLRGPQLKHRGNFTFTFTFTFTFIYNEFREFVRIAFENCVNSNCSKISTFVSYNYLCILILVVIYKKSSASSVTIETRLRAGRERFDSRQREKWIFFLFNTESRASVSYPMGMGRGFFPRWQSGRSVKLTTHLHLVPILRIRGATHLLPMTLHFVKQGERHFLPSLSLCEYYTDLCF
jgi:hypothetical protein